MMYGRIGRRMVEQVHMGTDGRILLSEQQHLFRREGVGVDQQLRLARRRGGKVDTSPASDWWRGAKPHTSLVSYWLQLEEALSHPSNMAERRVIILLICPQRPHSSAKTKGCSLTTDKSNIGNHNSTLKSKLWRVLKKVDQCFTCDKKSFRRLS